MLSREDGNVLAALMAAILLGTLVTAGLTNALMRTQITANFVASEQALQLADAGYRHAIVVLDAEADGFDDDLLGPDLKGGTVDDGYPIGASPLPLGSGTYEVRLTDNDDGDGDMSLDSDDSVNLWVRGRVGSATRVIRVTIRGALSETGFVSGGGVLVDSNLTLKNHLEVYGPEGQVHANGDVTVENQVQIEGNVTATGSLSITSDDASIGGEDLTPEQVAEYAAAHSGADHVEVPEIDPWAFEGMADYRMTADGRVLDSDGALVFDTDDGDDDWDDWEFDKGTWKLRNGDSSSVADAMYFIDGNVEVSGHVGSNDDPVSASLVATGSMSVGGHAYLRASKEDVLFVVGGDLQFSGHSGSLEYFGNILVHEQAEISGHTAINGSLIVENGEDLFDDVTPKPGEGALAISGHTLINTNGVAPPTLPGESTAVTAIDWYETRVLAGTPFGGGGP